MTMMKGLLAAGIALAGLTVATQADAAVIFDVAQNGADVVITASGTFDRALATASGTITNAGAGYLRASLSRLNLNVGTGTVYSFTSTQALGSGTTGFATTAQTGLMIGFIPGNFFIDINYVSNSQIVASGTIANKTLAGMGMAVGAYDYAVGGNALRVNILAPTPTPTPTPEPAPQAGAVPEPATWAMMLFGFGGLGYAMRRRPGATARIRFA